MLRLTTGILTVLTMLIATLLGTPACAQPTAPTTYELMASSSFTTGCQGPSGCACPVQVVGMVQGTFDLQELFPPLLPIRDFAVTNIQWTISPGTPNSVFVAGSGSYHVNISTGMHLMTLDLLINGAMQQFTSMGFVAGGSNHATAFAIDIFSQLDICTYDGFLLEASVVAPRPVFVRGECNLDGAFDIADVVYLLGALFPQGLPPVLDCADACDANDDGNLNIADPIRMLSTLFPQGPPAPLPPPFPDCGVDPTADGLTCLASDPCCPGSAQSFLTLDQGELTGLNEQVTIIRDDATWQTVWAQHSPLPCPTVDFSQEMVVVVVRVFNTSGSSLEIDSLCHSAPDVEVHFTTNICFGPLPVVIHPYHIVTTPLVAGNTVPVETVTMNCP